MRLPKEMPTDKKSSAPDFPTFQRLGKKKAGLCACIFEVSESLFPQVGEEYHPVLTEETIKAYYHPHVFGERFREFHDNLSDMLGIPKGDVSRKRAGEETSSGPAAKKLRVGKPVSELPDEAVIACAHVVSVKVEEGSTEPPMLLVMPSGVYLKNGSKGEALCGWSLQVQVLGL